MDITRLPILVLDTLFSNLSIRDCYNVAEAYYILPVRKSKGFNINGRIYEYTTIASALQKRISVVSYLSHRFNNPTLLLGSMLENGVLISGSTALEYFVGNSLALDSDYDFYISHNVQNIYNFMVYMENYENVKWKTIEQSFTDKIFNNDKTAKITLRTIDRLLEYLVDNLESDSKLVSILQNIRSAVITGQIISDGEFSIGPYEDSNIYTIKSETRDIKIQIEMDQDFYPITNVIEGIVFKDGYQTTIQLIVCGDMDGNEGIEDVLNKLRMFDTALTQCFISPHGAVHMYPEDAYKRESRIWNTESTPHSLVSSFVSKYNKRDFKFYTPELSKSYNSFQTQRYIKRLLCDTKCHCISLDIDLGYSKEDMVLFKSTSYDFSWVEEYHMNGVTLHYDIERYNIENRYAKSYPPSQRQDIPDYYIINYMGLLE